MRRTLKTSVAALMFNPFKCRDMQVIYNNAGYRVGRKTDTYKVNIFTKDCSESTEKIINASSPKEAVQKCKKMMTDEVYSITLSIIYESTIEDRKIQHSYLCADIYA